MTTVKQAVERKFARRPISNQTSKNYNTHGVGQGRQVSHKVFIGNVEVQGFQRFDKDESPYSAGSSMTVTLRMEDELDIHALSQKIIPLTLRVTTTVLVDGVLAFKADTDEFEGIIDTIEEDYDTASVTVSARSYAQVLLNEKVNEVFSSAATSPKTTSQVVKELVAKYGKGLKCVVHDFKTPVGKFFKDRAVKVTNNVPAWDLIVSFANEDHADVFVKGDTLYYVRKSTDVAPDITELKGAPASYEYVWGINILSLKVRHAPMFSHDIQVTVTSYQPKTGKSFVGKKNMTAAKLDALAAKLEKNPDDIAAMQDKSLGKYANKRRAGRIESKASAARIGNKENYSFFVPGLTQEDCDRLAAKIMADISRKEFIVNMTVLAQPDFTPRQYIKLSGTRSKNTDQVYAIKNMRTSSEVPQSGGTSDGYKTQFTLVNHSVQTVGTNLGN